MKNGVLKVLEGEYQGEYTVTVRVVMDEYVMGIIDLVELFENGEAINLTIPEGVERIFLPKQASNIVDLELPSSVTSIRASKQVRGLGNYLDKIEDIVLV